MIINRPNDALHKAIMYRLLINILNDKILSQNLFFKGGSCALMLSWLDRFSVDLDFDLKKGANKKILRNKLGDIFKKLDLKINQEAQKTLFFVLKYQSTKGKRNTIKLSIVDNPPKSNIYEVSYLKEIDRMVRCQTKETMFANKLVAVVDRYEKYQMIAGRDIYDLHYFFSQGYGYNKKVIKERRGVEVDKYLKQLINFIDKKVTEKTINQDLNYILSENKLDQIKKTLKREVLMFLRDELRRLTEKPVLYR